MANVVVNAVGDQCPIPVVKATKALKEMKEAGILEVHVDNEIAVQNLTKLANTWKAESFAEKKEEKLFVVTMKVADPAAQAPAFDRANRMCGRFPEYRHDKSLRVLRKFLHTRSAFGNPRTNQHRMQQ